MSKPKIAIVFYTTYGTNHAIAEAAAEAARAAGAEVRLRRVRETAPEDVIAGQEAWQAQIARMSDIPEATPEDMEWADGYFFSAPTRFGDVASQMRGFIDTLGPLWQKGALADKVVTATTSAQNEHGGQESTLLAFYTTVMHWGSLIVAPGYTDEVLFESGGNPYGYSAKAGDFDAVGRKAVAHQATRLVDFAARIQSKEIRKAA